jgi:hypothetical protein
MVRLMNRIDYYPSRQVLLVPFVAAFFLFIGALTLLMFGREVLVLGLIPIAGGAYMLVRNWRYWFRMKDPTVTLFPNHMVLSLSTGAVHVPYKDIRGIYWEDGRHGRLSISVETDSRIVEHAISPAFLSADLPEVFTTIRKRIPMHPKHEAERGCSYAASFES